MTSRRDRPARAVAVVAADIGNSKTDLVLVAADGSVLGSVRGPTASHQAVGLVAGTRRLAELSAAAGGGRAAPADVAVVCAAGADTPSLVRRLRRSYGRAGLARRVVVRNDTEALLRAGSPEGWGIALVCGSGVNCLGISRDGRTARLLALGPITGDRGGGLELGMAALGAAVRARDGRGPRTALEQVVPAFFGLRRPADVAIAIEEGRVVEARLADLAPAVLRTADAGDPVASGIVAAVADEQVTMAVAAIRRLRLVRRRVPVVLGGGVYADPAFEARVREGLAVRTPLASATRLAAPPVVGAALLGLDALGAPAAASARLRAQLTEGSLSASSLGEADLDGRRRG